MYEPGEGAHRETDLTTIFWACNVATTQHGKSELHAFGKCNLCSEKSVYLPFAQTSIIRNRSIDLTPYWEAWIAIMKERDLR